MSDQIDRESSTDLTWIAVQPLRNRDIIPTTDEGGIPAYDHHLGDRQISEGSVDAPPSFPESQFDVVLRRQRMRPPEGGGLKLNDLPSRFLNLSNHFEFAGWGTITSIKLDEEDRRRGEELLHNTRHEKNLGQFVASGLAGNDILGGVFYTLPAVMTVAGVYSPISLLFAVSTMFLWRPILAELASALPIGGGLYAYLLNVTTKRLALAGAALLLLDFASTAVVSAATATSYIVNEVHLPFPAFVCTVAILALFTVVCLTGVKESVRVAFVVLVFHIITMLVLILASLVQWGRIGNDQLRDNWHGGQPASTKSIFRQAFNGFVIGFLGLTGFECAPALVTSIKQGVFPSVLRNLHVCSFVINLFSSVLVLALIPVGSSLQQANILSTLANVASGKWLRIWVAVDAIVVLCAGVLTGVLSASELCEQLARDRVLPRVFLKTLPVTRSPFVAILSFAGVCVAFFASSGGNSTILSQVFALNWLFVMTLFPCSLLLLKFNRGRLPRSPRTSLTVIFISLAIAVAASVGNVLINLAALGYFLAYFIGITLLFLASQSKTHFLRWVYWGYDQNPSLHRWRWSLSWGDRLTKLMTLLRRQPVCVLAKTDEINYLFRMILYVRQNEETSHLKIVHFHDGEGDIPSEMEANAKILDEQFPEITIDLLLVHGEFSPVNVAALSHRLNIPPSLMFISCPSIQFPHSVSDLGTRIVAM